MTVLAIIHLSDKQLVIKTRAITASAHPDAADIFDNLQDYGQNTFVVVRQVTADIHLFVLAVLIHTGPPNYNWPSLKKCINKWFSIIYHVKNAPILE